MPQLLPQPLPPQLAVIPPPPEDLEKVAEVEVEVTRHKPLYSSLQLHHHNLNWSKLVIAFCFGSALEIAHQSQQFSQPSDQFPSTLYLLLCFAISVSFSCIFVAMFIGSKFSMAAQVLELVGVFSAVTGFFLAITSPFPLCLKCTIWALYGISLLAILICKLF